MGELMEVYADVKEMPYRTRHEMLRDKIAKYCLPDQADKVLITILADMQGYDPQDTYRNVSNTILELAANNLGIKQ